MKKISCIILSLIILLGTCMPVFAETGDTTTPGEPPVCTEHTEVIDEAVAPTCTTIGKTEGKHCSTCNEVIEAQVDIPATGHTEVVDEAVAKTCTTAGKTEGKHCSTCNEVIVAQEDVPAGHTEVVDEAIGATCTTAGKTEGKHCSACNEVIVAQENIDATGHTFDYTVEIATCEENGKITATCTGCDLTVDFTILASHHPESDGWETISAPSCDEKGELKKHCDLCNTDVTIEPDATGHTEVVDEAIAPTCTTAGKTEGKHCSTCNEVIIAQEEIPATGHTEVVDEKIDATCTTAGKTEGKHCSTCNEVIVAQEDIPATGHTEVVDEKVDATCTTAGKTEGKHCSTCNEVIVAQEEIPATGHSWTKDDSLKCDNCNEIEPIKEIISVTCEQEVFEKDDVQALTFTLIVKTENEREVTLKKVEPMVTGLDTTKTGTQKVTITYNEVTKEDVEISVKKPRITVKLGKDTLFNEYSTNIYRDGLTFTVTSSSGDKIKWTAGKNIGVTKVNNTTYKVAPTKYFKMDYTDYEDYYVEFYFERNSEKYPLKVYLNYDVASVKCTGTTYFVQGTGKKKQTITYIETYNDGHFVETKETFTINTNKVGRKTLVCDYYDDAAPFVCYVKCKTPVVTAKGAKKSVKLSWKKVEGATGYNIYRSTSKTGKYSLVKSITNASTLTYTNTGLASKKAYYYKVVAVYKANKNCNSDYSSAKKATTK